MPLWIKEAAGQPYMPSNGTEGACFHEMHCANCERDKVMNGTATIEEADGDMTMLCEILGRSFREDELAEWKFGPDGWPMCTAFVPLGEKIPAPRCEHTSDLFGGMPQGPNAEVTGLGRNRSNDER